MGYIRKKTGIDLTGGGEEDAVREASRLSEQTSQESIGEQRDALGRIRSHLEPSLRVGAAAEDPILNLLGIGRRQDIERKLADPNISRPVRNKLERELSTMPAPAVLPDAPQALDTSQLPSAGTAFDPTDVDNPIMDFLLKEGFRGIREGAAGGGRKPDRDLVEFAQGTAATLAPQIQAQRFGQQQALRSQALGEQAQQFGQQGAIRGQALGDQQTKISNLAAMLGLGQRSGLGLGQFEQRGASNISNLLGGIGKARGAVPFAEAKQASKLGTELGEFVGLNDIKGGGFADAAKMFVGG